MKILIQVNSAKIAGLTLSSLIHILNRRGWILDRESEKVQQSDPPKEGQVEGYSWMNMGGYSSH